MKRSVVNKEIFLGGVIEDRSKTMVRQIVIVVTAFFILVFTYPAVAQRQLSL